MTDEPIQKKPEPMFTLLLPHCKLNCRESERCAHHERFRVKKAYKPQLVGDLVVDDNGRVVSMSMMCPVYVERKLTLI